MKKVIKIIVFVILAIVLFVNGVILVDSFIHPDEVPSFFGWKPFIVLSGSMETEICAGDVAVVKEVDTSTLKENDVIAFKQDNIVITHRIKEIINEDGETKFITKGDNNNMEDTGYVLENQVEGKYQFRISRLGNVAMFVQTPIGIIVSLSIPIIIFEIAEMMQSKEDKKNLENKNKKEQELKEEVEKLKKQNEELLKK